MRSLHRSTGLVKLAALPQANMLKLVFMTTQAGGGELFCRRRREMPIDCDGDLFPNAYRLISFAMLTSPS